ncbi:hypothetical protein [Bacillus thuringiensis]|uniref:hypothetical protein n=1 Tax=Bacillus thuringiensis TaxID=1428 RepID=UPI000BF8D474|nr:hypothetical protein [Bacillus thuringiensis]PFJ57521.1 hypothetical protein COJ10_26820 [Bacillus thuringiensis]
MNNFESATRQINEFLESDEEKVILIKGTDDYKKHSLALEMINQNKNLKRGLFRTHRLKSVSEFFKQAKLEVPRNIGESAGKSYLVGNTTFYFDSFNEKTWGKTPHELDFALVYPIEILKDDLKKNFLQNIIEEKAIKKIFMVSNIDNRGEYEWVDECVNRTIELDVE